MALTPVQILIMIFAIALGVAITRFLPFFLFPENKQPPQHIFYLGQVLPPAMMGLLVVYCLRNISFFQAPYGVPEFVGIAVLILLHLWKRNVLLSIGVGTLAHILLVQDII